MSAWKAMVAAIIIFVAGCATGAFAVRWLSKAATPYANAHFTPGMGKVQRLEYVRRLERHLKLTPEQKENVEQILRESQERMKKLWEPISPEMQREFQAAREKIQALLTTEQLAQYQELMKPHPWRKGDENGAWDRDPRRDWRRGAGPSGKPNEAGAPFDFPSRRDTNAAAVGDRGR